jgi:hypothetical protein
MLKKSVKERPFAWQMIKGSVDNLNGQISYSGIKESSSEDRKKSHFKLPLGTI